MNDEPEIIEIDPQGFKWNVPECCSEGWDTCEHVAKPVKPTKTNIGL